MIHFWPLRSLVSFFAGALYAGCNGLQRHLALVTIKIVLIKSENHVFHV